MSKDEMILRNAKTIMEMEPVDAYLLGRKDGSLAKQKEVDGTTHQKTMNVYFDEKGRIKSINVPYKKGYAFGKKKIKEDFFSWAHTKIKPDMTGKDLMVEKMLNQAYEAGSQSKTDEITPYIHRIRANIPLTDGMNARKMCADLLTKLGEEQP